MNEYEVALRQFLEDEGYTNIEISEGYDENNFEVETDEEDMEFFVGTYDESYEAAKQDVLSLLDEMGIDALSPDYDWTEFVDDDYFDEELPEGTNFEFDFPMEEVFDEEGNLILDSVDFECTICGTENEVEIKPHLIMKTEYLDGNDYSYEEEVTCSLCGVSHRVGFSFEE